MLLVVTLVFVGIGVAAWGLTWQMNHLVEDLPAYPANVRTKIADVRLAGSGSAVEKLQEALEGLKTDLEASETPKGTVSRPLVVASNQVTGFLGFAWLGPVVGPLSPAGLVAAIVIFTPPIVMEITSARMQAVELVSLVRDRTFAVGSVRLTCWEFGDGTAEAPRTRRFLRAIRPCHLIPGVACDMRSSS